MKRSVIHLGLGLFLLAACAQAEAPGPQRALLWKVSDADNSLYLLGSFHALKPEDYPLPPAVEAAFSEAEAVAFEVPPAEMESPELAKQMMRAGILPEGQTLQSNLSAAAWHRLDLYCSKNGLKVQDMQRFAPWFMSLMMSLREMQRLGFDPKLGLDRNLMARASSSNKPTSGLETAADQIGVLSGMALPTQVQLLEEALDEAQSPNGNMESLHQDWRRGDAKAIESAMVLQLRDKYRQLYQRINVDRNRAWMPKLVAMLDRHKRDDVLIVVGSLHLVGPDGLIEQLRAKGYTVQRL